MLTKRLFLMASLFFLLSAQSVIGEDDTVKRLNLPVGSSPQIGSEKAALTVIEFVDFQ